MTARRVTLAVMLVAFVPSARNASAQPIAALTLEAECETRAGGEVSAFSALLRNAGERDIATTIGVTLNGIVYQPALLRVLVTDAGGATSVLRYTGGVVQGQIRPWVVVVPAGGLYRVTLPTDRLFLGRPSERKARFSHVINARVALTAGPRVLADGEPAEVPAGALFATGEYESNDIRVPSQCTAGR